MKIISIINNKGGVGKTTTTQNLAGYLSRQGYKIGLIDFDGQANLTNSYKIEDSKIDLLTALVKGDKLTLEDFSSTQYKNISILYNNSNINSATLGQIQEVKRLGALKRIVKGLDFDYILIDTAPSIDMNTLCPLFASDYVLIPLQYEKYSISGLNNLFETINILNDEQSANIQVLGVLSTRVDERLLMTEVYRPILQENLGSQFFNSFIRTNSKYQQAQDQVLDIFDIEDPKGIEDYTNLGKEILEKLNK